MVAFADADGAVVEMEKWITNTQGSKAVTDTIGLRKGEPLA